MHGYLVTAMAQKPPNTKLQTGPVLSAFPPQTPSMRHINRPPIQCSDSFHEVSDDDNGRPSDAKIHKQESKNKRLLLSVTPGVAVLLFGLNAVQHAGP